MRISIVLVLLFAMLSTLTAQWDKDHNYITQERSSQSFYFIEVGSAIQVEITKGNRHSIEVKADEDIINDIQTEVNGDRLSIYVSRRKPMRNTGTMLVTITMPELSGIEAGGASKVTTFSAFSGDRLSVDVGGAAQVKVEFNGRKVVAEVGGAGILNLAGSAEEVDFDVDSAGSIRAQNFTAKIAKVDASSAASVKLTVTEEINAEASSAASIRYDGNPKRVFTDTSSAGSIKG